MTTPTLTRWGFVNGLYREHPDGYWTPWHIAMEAVVDLEMASATEQPVAQYQVRLNPNMDWINCVDESQFSAAVEAGYEGRKLYAAVGTKGDGSHWPYQDRPPPPAEVMYALDSMCFPLHESRLSGVTASEDARCMTLIRDYCLAKTGAQDRIDAERLLPHEYLLAKIAMVIPLFEEARDALSALTEQQRVRHGISKSLADRMDIAGTYSLEDFDSARKAK